MFRRFWLSFFVEIQHFLMHRYKKGIAHVVRSSNANNNSSSSSVIIAVIIVRKADIYLSLQDFFAFFVLVLIQIISSQRYIPYITHILLTYNI